MRQVDAYSTDQAVLIGLAFAMRDQFRVLICEQPFSYEPYGLVMRRGDPDFRVAVNTVISRILRCREAGVPITNYGVVITYSLGVLDRALSPFPAFRNDR